MSAAADASPASGAVAASNCLFISYSRSDAAMVRWVLGALAERGIDAWVDWEDIPPTAEWMAEIERGIDSADAFAFFISPRSLASAVCAQELAHAVAAGKRLVPVVFADPGGTVVPTSLARLNWIFARNEAEQVPAIERLVEALSTDLDALRMHARLLVRAREWIASGHDASWLLRGADLDSAQRWLHAVGANGPFPSPEHEAFVLASQWAQRAEADRWQQLFHRSQARLMAAQSELLRAQDVVRLELSVLLAAESLRREPTLEAAQSLQQGLKLLPPRGRLALRHDEGRVNDIVFTPDGRWLVSAGDDGTLRVHDVATGREHARLEVGERVMDLRLAPEGDRVAALCFQSRQVVLARVPDAALVGPLPHAADVTAAAWHPDGARLLTGATDGKVRVWKAWIDAAGGGEAAFVMLHAMDVGGVPGALAPSPDGACFACACNGGIAKVRGAEGGVAVYDIGSGATLWHLPLGEAVLDVAFSPDGRHVASAGWDLQARVFDVADGRPVAAVTHEQVVTHVRFSPDGSLLASLSDDGTAVVLDLVRGEVMARLRPQGGVLRAAFSADGRRLATSGLGPLVQLWDIATQQELLRGSGDSGANALAFSADGAELGVARWARIDSVRLRDDGDDVPLRHGLALQSGAFSADGRWAALAPGDGHLEVLDLTAGRRVARFAVPGDIEFVQVGNDGRLVLTQAVISGAVCAWAVENGDLLWRSDPALVLHGMRLSACGRHVALTPLQGDLAWTHRAGDGALCFTMPYQATMAPAFSADGEHVLTAGDGELLVRRSADGTVTQALRPAGTMFGAEFSAGDTRIVARADDGWLHVWDRASCAEALHLEHGGGYVASAACSADGRWLASAGAESVRLWDAASGAPGPQFAVEGGVDYVTFTPDSRCVAAGSRDQRARIWDLATGAEVACIAFEGEVFEMQFDAAGRYVLVEHMRGATRQRTAWRWRPEDLLALAAVSATRELTADERRRYVGDEPAKGGGMPA